MEMPVRRRIDFQSLEDAVREAELLLTAGYVQTGNWNLSQTCRHLTDWIRFPLDGFPHASVPMRMMFFVLRHAAGRRILNRMLASGFMPAGSPTVPATVYKPGCDDADAVAQFRAVVERFQQHKGALHPSPVFGTLDAETATRLQRIHCAHHLSFLVPRNGQLLQDG